MTEAAVKIETAEAKCKDLENQLQETQNQLKDAKVSGINIYKLPSLSA